MTELTRRDDARDTKAHSSARATNDRRAGIATWLLVAVLCTVQFVDVLGTTFLIVALPSVQRDMGLSNASTELLAGIFALFFGSLLILGGKLADVFGARRMLIAGLGVFVAASVIGGTAPNPFLLFASRSGQGVSAALAVPAALSLLTALFPSGSNRNRALGIWTAAGAAGAAAGFAAGGVVTDMLGWRWIFLLNIPILLIALGLVFRLAPPDVVIAVRRSVNVRGALLLTSGLLSLILSLSRLRSSSGTGQLATNLAVLIAGLALLIGFAFVERSSARPLIPVRLVRLRSLAGTSLVAFTLTFTTTSASVILTLYLQRVLDVEPTRSGLLLSPVSVAVVAGSVAGSRLISTRGFGLPMVFGLLAITGSMLLFVVGMRESSLVWIVSGLVVLGIGLGSASVASTACGLSSIGEADKGLASGLITSMAMLGTATGIVALGAIAALRTSTLASGPDPLATELTAGFQLAIIIAAALALAAVPVATRSSIRTRRGAG